jgi:HSP20 family protein
MPVVRRHARWPFPAVTEWLEAPMSGWPGFGPPMRIEDFVQEGRYVVRAELPGIQPDKDVEVFVGDGMLTVRAQRSEETKERHRSEFRYGSFERTVRLPRGVDEDDVKASYKDGILEVSVGLAEAKPGGRRIAVESEG